MSKNNVGVSLSALLSTISKRDIAVSFGFGCVACIVIPFYGLYFVHFHFLLEVSTMWKSDVVVSFCIWHSCMLMSSHCIVPDCCPLLCPILWLAKPLFIFPRGFDNVEKRCCCFIIVLFRIAILFCDQYSASFQFVLEVSTMSKSDVVVSFCA